MKKSPFKDVKEFKEFLKTPDDPKWKNVLRPDSSVPEDLISQVAPGFAEVVDDVMRVLIKHQEENQIKNSFLLGALGEAASRIFQATEAPLHLVEKWASVIVEIRKSQLETN